MDADRLDAIAATQIIGDPEVAHCWPLIREGIRTDKIGLGNLANLIAHLRAGNGKTLDELTVEVLLDDPARVLVALLDDHRTCPPTALIVELERLLVRAGGSAGSSPSPGAPPPSSVPPAGRSAGPADAPDLLGVLAGLLGTTPARLAGDPDAYRAQVERVRTATASLAAAVADPTGDDAGRRAAAAGLRQVLVDTVASADATAQARTADVPATLAALGIDLDRFAAALRTVTDWLEQRTPAAGAAVDRLVAALDAAAGPLLGGPDRAARDAARDDRARTAARTAIAARLGKPPTAS